MSSVAAWLDDKRRRMRIASRQWLRAHPRTSRLLRAGGCMGTQDGALARGVAVGLFIALTPTAGIQTPVTVLACMAVRANFPLAFAVSWISNPLTWAPMYLSFNLLGETLFATFLRPLFGIIGSADSALLEATYVGLGSLVVAVPVAILGYMLTRLLEQRVQRRKLASP